MRVGSFKKKEKKKSKEVVVREAGEEEEEEEMEEGEEETRATNRCTRAEIRSKIAVARRGASLDTCSVRRESCFFGF